jgi:hypothetical protein
MMAARRSGVKTKTPLIRRLAPVAILVPGYLILVDSGRLGRLGVYLGAKREPAELVQK